MITHDKSKRLMQLIENYRAAAVDESWKGTSDPADAGVLEHDLEHTRSELAFFVNSITANRDTIHLPQNVRQARAMLAVASMFLQEHEPKKPRSTELPPDPEGKNDERALWAQLSLDQFQKSTGADHEDMVSDLICDLMHWCDRNGQIFDNELRRARGHYEDETRVPS